MMWISSKRETYGTKVFDTHMRSSFTLHQCSWYRNLRIADRLFSNLVISLQFIQKPFSTMLILLQIIHIILQNHFRRFFVFLLLHCFYVSPIQAFVASKDPSM